MQRLKESFAAIKLAALVQDNFGDNNTATRHSPRMTGLSLRDPSILRPHCPRPKGPFDRFV
jgi:hypothetical protein